MLRRLKSRHHAGLPLLFNPLRNHDQNPSRIGLAEVGRPLLPIDDLHIQIVRVILDDLLIN